MTRVQHDPGKHEDRCVALGMAATALVEKSFGGARMHIPTGDVPKVQLVPPRSSAPPDGAAPAVVRPGEQRPVDRLTEFQRARRHPGYRGPGQSGWR